MGREHIEFVASTDIAKTPVADGPFAGTEQRLLSMDDGDAGDYTALNYLPAGWTGDLSGSATPTELFVIEGALRIGDGELRTGCYGYVPAAADGATLASENGSVVLVLVDPPEERCGDIEIHDTNEMTWTNAPPGIPPGIVVKRLRSHPVTGDATWVAGVAPGWREERAEMHDTIEECLMIKGDILLGERGIMGAGSYFWRPPRVKHGPMYTNNGGVFFFRSKGGGLATEHVEVPGWERMVADYRDSEPYFPGQL